MEYIMTCDMEYFENFTFILPAISVGNVGQLTCDLLISSLNFKKAGYFSTSYVLPVIGSDPFARGTVDSLTLSVEVFIDKEKRLAVMQQRAPLVCGKQEEYTKKLISWTKEMRFKEIILVTSCHAYERKDDELMGSCLRYLNPSEDSATEECLKERCNLEKLQKRKTDCGDEIYFMPGAGTAKRFLEELNTTKDNPSATILMVFCSEGDNIPEAVSMANAINTWKKYLLEDSDWVFPSSWKHLFGKREPSSIF